MKITMREMRELTVGGLAIIIASRFNNDTKETIVNNIVKELVSKDVTGFDFFTIVGEVNLECGPNSYAYEYVKDIQTRIDAIEDEKFNAKLNSDIMNHKMEMDDFDKKFAEISARIDAKRAAFRR